MNPPINLNIYDAPEGGKWVAARPSGYQSPERFSTFKNCCARADLAFSRTAQAQLGPVERLPRLMRLLRAAGFEIEANQPEYLREFFQHFAEVERHIQWLIQTEFPRIDGLLKERMAGHKLLPYQQTDIVRMVRDPVGINANEQGLGKTLEGLCSIYPSRAPVLVVGPATAKGVWEDETHSLRPDMTVSILDGVKSFRWPQEGELCVISFACLPAFIPEGCVRGTNLLIDEIHNTANPKTQRATRMKQVINHVYDACGRVWGLSGTPMDTGIHLWELAALLGLEDSCFGEVPACKNAWEGFIHLFGGELVKRYIPAMTTKDGRKIPARKMPQWTFNPHRVKPEGPVRLARMMFRNKKADVLKDLPPKRYQMIPVQLRELFKGTEAKEIRKMLDETYEATKNCPDDQLLEHIEKSPQFTRYSEFRRLLATAKTGFVMQMLDELQAQGKPVVVFSVHMDPVLTIGARPGWGMVHGGVKDRQQVARDFQSGRIHHGVVLTLAGKEALTLTRADLLIFVDRYWRWSDNAQVEDRVHRLTQTQPVVIQDIVLDHPLDKKVYLTLRRKQQMMQATLEAMAGLAKPDVVPELSWEDLNEVLNYPVLT